MKDLQMTGIDMNEDGTIKVMTFDDMHVREDTRFEDERYAQISVRNESSMITISKRREQDVQINWSAIGSVSIERTKEFAHMMKVALVIAETYQSGTTFAENQGLNND